MARVNIPIKKTDLDGVVIADAEWVSGDVADHHKFLNDGKTKLLVKGAGLDATVVLTFNTTFKRDEIDLGSQVVSKAFPITVDHYLVVGPFRKGTFNQLTGDDKGYVYFSTDNASIDMQCISG